MKLYKFKSLSNLGHVLDIVLHERLYCALYTELNDPFEGQFISGWRVRREDMMTPLEELIAQQNGGVFRSACDLNSVLPQGSKAPRICSLSRRCDDVRMWSHYADSHQGVAIEIDFSGIQADAHEVSYSAKLKLYGDHLQAETPTVINVLTSKTDHWSYETEHRVIQSEPFYSVLGRIRSIICGMRVSPDIVALLRKVAPKNIHVRTTRLDYNGTTVILDPLPEVLHRVLEREAERRGE